jgi:hypothetical protein
VLFRSREFAGWIEANSERFKILRYGFQLKKTDLQQDIVHDPMEVVLGRVEGPPSGSFVRQSFVTVWSIVPNTERPSASRISICTRSP